MAGSDRQAANRNNGVVLQSFSSKDRAYPKHWKEEIEEIRRLGTEKAEEEIKHIQQMRELQKRKGTR